ncbi:hypothetical protein QJQ45_010230 [Haematococcus lacustris]|nr:hypothetical protein QJQ45_010230 [Haematococcus lacustris]
MASANDLELALLDAAASGDIATLSALVENGVDVSYQDQEGMSALMKAADGGYQEAVELLLQAGCPCSCSEPMAEHNNAMDPVSPLHYCHADYRNLQDKDGYCAGQYAAGNPEIVELLLNWGVQAELVLGAVKRSEEEEDAGQDGVVNQAYLSQPLHYSDDGSKLLDADGEAVMMGWEGPLMERHAALLQARGGAVLNIGFGLGLIDAALQAYSPSLHTIIEAHPDVFKHAQHKGWGTRPGVQLLHGRWQEVLPRLVAQQGQRYDGVFFDTYGEYYREMALFHKQLPALLKPGGVYTFFNGLAPDNVFFHSVYGRLVQLELAALGLSTSYEKVDIQQAVQPEPPPGPVQRPQAPPWGRWLDRDTNPFLNFQRIGESKQRPLELCSWKDREALPPVGKEYQQGYKLVNDRLPKVKQRLHRAAEYRRGIDGRACNNA